MTQSDAQRSSQIPTGAPSPGRLSDARLQLHWAAQIVAAVGHNLLPARPDDSQSNLGWSARYDALVGHLVAGELRAGLSLPDLRLLLLDPHDRLLCDRPLDGRTLNDGLSFFTSATTQISGSPPAAPLKLRDYQMPPHPVAEGESFSLSDRAAFAELARWYAVARSAVAGAIGAFPKTSPLRCWPHHFDLAALIELDPGQSPERARTIGVGLSCGKAWRRAQVFFTISRPKKARSGGNSRHIWGRLYSRSRPRGDRATPNRKLLRGLRGWGRFVGTLHDRRQRAQLDDRRVRQPGMR